MNNPKKNFIYNLIYQVLILIIPLITAPYLSRKVGANGVGIYSYTYSIVYYFMLLTLLGVNNYGNREIAKVRENKHKLSNTFWSIYVMQLIMGIIMLVIYFMYVIFFQKDYFEIACIQSIYIISAILDINWFYFGIEQFKTTIARNTFIKIGSVILIFIFVKSSGDLWKYTIIMSGMTMLSQIILWIPLKKYISFTKIKAREIVKHIKPNIILFIPVIAISLYKIMDKIMLGSIANVNEVAYYEYAEKIINIPMTIITALGTVMLPRISNIMSKGDFNKVNEYIRKSLKFVMFMSFAMCAGLICIGYNFAPLYFGNEFQKTGYLIMILSITLPCLSFANVLRTQYLIPGEKDKIYIKSVFAGAVINFIFNIILIKPLLSIGACIGTVAAEFTVMFVQTYSLRKELNIKMLIKSILPFLFKALIMFIPVYCINLFDINTYMKIILQIIVGIIIYFVLNIKYINETINIREILRKLGGKKVEE